MIILRALKKYLENLTIRTFRGKNLLKLQKNFWENEAFSSVQYTLQIKCKNLEVNTVSETLNLNSPVIIKKGEIISKALGTCEEDIYMYEKKFSQFSIEDFENFLDEIVGHSEILKKYSTKDEVKIRIFIQSSQAQIFFEFYEKQINLLNKLSLPIEFSILSWGEV